MKSFDPFDAAESLTSVKVGGVDLRKGDRVRLWPKKNADIFDLALTGRLATIESLERTLEGEVYVAVTVDEDPGKDFGELRQVGHRFFFRVNEIEPASAEARER